MDRPASSEDRALPRISDAPHFRSSAPIKWFASVFWSSPHNGHDVERETTNRIAPAPSVEGQLWMIPHARRPPHFDATGSRRSRSVGIVAAPHRSELDEFVRLVSSDASHRSVADA